MHTNDTTLIPYVDDVAQTRMTIYMGFVSFMILIWDHIVTFGDEVEYIWMGKKGILVLLFAINRYITPFGFIINLFAYMSPVWTPTMCSHFVRYEGSMTVIGINTTALMMLLRVSAMYSRRPIVIGGVAAAFCVEFGVNAWLLSHGIAVIHNRPIHACTMIFDDRVKRIASASAWLPLTYDTIVLILTLKRTLGPVRNKTAGKIARVLLRDGILYYSVIFSVNLVLTLMIATAPPGLQNITAQLEYLLTVAMMSRITLHLRKQARSREDDAQLETYPLTTLSSVSALRSRLRFTRSSAAQDSADPRVAVTVEETTVVYDDSGRPLVASPPGSPAVKGPAAGVEWFQVRPPAPVRLPTGRSERARVEKNPELRYIV